MEVSGWKGTVAKGKRSVPGVGKSCSFPAPQGPHLQKRGEVPTVVLGIQMGGTLSERVLKD